MREPSPPSSVSLHASPRENWAKCIACLSCMCRAEQRMMDFHLGGGRTTHGNLSWRRNASNKADRLIHVLRITRYKHAIIRAAAFFPVVNTKPMKVKIIDLSSPNLLRANTDRCVRERKKILRMFKSGGHRWSQPIARHSHPPPGR